MGLVMRNSDSQSALEVRKYTYMNDMLASGDTLENAVKIQTEQLLEADRFQLTMTNRHNDNRFFIQIVIMPSGYFWRLEE